MVMISSRLSLTFMTQYLHVLHSQNVKKKNSICLFWNIFLRVHGHVVQLSTTRWKLKLCPRGGVSYVLESPLKRLLFEFMLTYHFHSLCWNDLQGAESSRLGIITQADRFIITKVLCLTKGLAAFYMADLIQTLMNLFYNPPHLNT